MRKECELCRQEAARMYCESDQASLCWECDAKVHAANFLVARHTRTLLCHHCNAPTPWSASGPNLGPTLSVCHLCVAARRPRKPDLAADRPSLELAGRGREDPRVEDAGSDGDREDVVEEGDFDDEEEEEEEGDVEEDGDDEEEDVDGEDEEEEGDNQVVPWSASPPPTASSSTSEESFPPYSSDTSHNNVKTPPSSKRMRDADDGGWHIEVESSRPLQPAGTGVGHVEATSSIVSHRHKRPLFVHRPSPSIAMQSETGEGRDRSHGRDDIDHLVSVTAAGGSGDRRF